MFIKNRRDNVVRLRFKRILCAILLAVLICQTGVSAVVIAEETDVVEQVVFEETVDEEVPVEEKENAQDALDDEDQEIEEDVNQYEVTEDEETVDELVDDKVETVEISTIENFYYISDLDYITENRWSYPGWGEIKKDTNIEGGTISLLVDGTRMYFKRGMGAHATSQLTYDVSSYSNVYTRFVAKMGVDAARNGNGEVWFRISASNDGNDWAELYKSSVVTSTSNAIDVDVDISNYKYLRLYSDSNGSNAADHSVYADARLVKTDYDLSSELVSFIKPLSYYDEILSKNTVEENYNNHRYTVLQREFVNRLGYWSLQSIMKDDETGTVKDAVDWIYNDEENLRLFIEAGNVDNSKLCMEALGSLYSKYKGDLSNLTYKKMLIALAISYSTDNTGTPLNFNAWLKYDVNERYEIMKELYDNGSFIRKEEFDSYHMELIRMVVNDSTPNDEIRWLRGYSESRYPEKLDSRLNPYSFMPYIHPNYHQDRLYSEANAGTYKAKYQLDNYNIPYGLNADGSKTERTWMVMEAGGICWNISRLGSNLNRVHGLPSMGVYQPDHESFLTYSVNKDGKGVWGIGNNIFGWGKSSTSWYGGNPRRLIFNWNNKFFTRKYMGLNVDIGNGKKSPNGNSAGYHLLGQAGLNDYDKYSKSFYYNLIANSYADGNKEEVYRKALNEWNLNLDSYEQLFNIYKEDNRSSKEWKKFAEEIVNVYTYYPMAMTDLLRIIEPYLNNDDVVDVDILKTNALNKAVKATEDDVLQSAACREIAEALLGDSKVDLASFSFDGTNAGMIVMNSKYDNYDFQVQYSLDNGKTWKATIEHKIVLSQEELDSITADNDIQVKISGSNQVFTIDILNGDNVSDKTLSLNDDENTFIGKIQYLEYSLDGAKTWNDYSSDVRFMGSVNVKVRYKAYGTRLAGGIKDYEFTADAESEDNSYIYVQHISYVSSNSSQPGYKPEHMIDGSPNTTWHTTWGQVAKDKSYVVRFDKVRYLSEVSYDPAGLNGRIKTAKVYVSMDGQDWTLVGEKANLGNDVKRKTITLSEVLPAMYVKIEAVETYGNHEGPNKYVSGTRFNYYEDTTKVFSEPVVEYSITSLTNQDVEATLRLPDGYKVIGDNKHLFKENGEFTFTYKDTHNKEQTIKAEVNWIDKVVPTATVEYDITETTQFMVKATLKNFSKEDVTILNADEDGSHTFYENGSFIFEIQDRAGNIGYVKAEVTWIEKDVDNKLVFESNVYDIQDTGIITNIDVNTTLEDFIKQVNTNAGSIKLTKDGEQTDVISTGSVLTLNDLVSYTLVVRGDLTKDGQSGDADLSMLNKHLVNMTTIEDRLTLLAADINNDGVIDIVDLSLLNKKHINK